MKKISLTISANKTISVIDSSTNTVTATVPVRSPNGVAVTPDEANVYVNVGIELVF